MIETLRERLARRPFSPFRVVLSSGDRYEVRHLEFAWLVKGGLYVGIPATESNGQSDLPERVVFCAALHLARVEQLVST